MADITYDLIKDTASFNHIPILTLDKRWYLLVPEVSKTDEIKYWEKKVNDLLKKQGQVTNDLKEVKKIKEQVIQDVVENMEEDDLPESIRKYLSTANIAMKIMYYNSNEINSHLVQSNHYK